jgi:RNA polymerase sigma-70 factor (ECF subfamily)
VSLEGITDGMAWIRAAAREAEFERLLVTHERLVLRTALRILGKLEDAQDAAQEVFLRLHRHFERVEPSTIEPWLYRTTVNVCYDAIRRRRPETGIDFDPPAPRSGGAEALEEAEKRRLVAEGLKRLPPKERAAVALCAIEGLETAEAAKILGVSEATVRSQMSMARTRLKEFVGRFWR